MHSSYSLCHWHQTAPWRASKQRWVKCTAPPLKNASQNSRVVGPLLTAELSMAVSREDHLPRVSMDPGWKPTHFISIHIARDLNSVSITSLIQIHTNNRYCFSLYGKVFENVIHSLQHSAGTVGTVHSPHNWQLASH